MIARIRTQIVCVSLIGLLLAAALLAAPAHAQTVTPSGGYTSDDVTHVSSLDLMEGHLRVSLQLWNLQQYDLAAKHAGHPVEELYASVESALKAAGTDTSLKSAIDAYAALAGKAGDANAVKTANAALIDTIHTAQQAVVAAPISASVTFQGDLIRRSLDVASSEYAEATSETGEDQLIDYQDSYGFIAVVQDRYQSIHDKGISPTNPDADKAITAQFAAFASVYPDVMKPPTPLVAADQFKQMTDAIGDTLTKVLNLVPDTFRDVDRAINSAKSGIDQALDAYQAGDANTAYELAASAYLDNFEGLEGALAKQDPALLSTIEGQFKDLRDGIQANKPLADLSTLATAIDANLDRVEALLTSVNPASMSMATEAPTAAN